MTHDPEAEDKDWKRIAAAFLRSPAKPTPYETEVFVRKVLSRLEEPSPQPWLGLNWLVPATSFALAVSLMLILRPALEVASPADELFLAGEEASGLAAMVSRPDSPTTGDVLALAMGER